TEAYRRGGAYFFFSLAGVDVLSFLVPYWPLALSRPIRTLPALASDEPRKAFRAALSRARCTSATSTIFAFTGSTPPQVGTRLPDCHKYTTRQRSVCSAIPGRQRFWQIAGG